MGQSRRTRYRSRPRSDRIQLRNDRGEFRRKEASERGRNFCDSSGQGENSEEELEACDSHAGHSSPEEQIREEEEEEEEEEDPLAVIQRALKLKEAEGSVFTEQDKEVAVTFLRQQLEQQLKMCRKNTEVPKTRDLSGRYLLEKQAERLQTLKTKYPQSLIIQSSNESPKKIMAAIEIAGGSSLRQSPPQATGGLEGGRKLEESTEPMQIQETEAPEQAQIHSSLGNLKDLQATVVAAGVLPIVQASSSQAEEGGAMQTNDNGGRQKLDNTVNRVQRREGEAGFSKSSCWELYPRRREQVSGRLKREVFYLKKTACSREERKTKTVCRGKAEQTQNPFLVSGSARRSRVARLLGLKTEIDQAAPDRRGLDAPMQDRLGLA